MRALIVDLAKGEKTTYMEGERSVQILLKAALLERYLPEKNTNAKSIVFKRVSVNAMMLSAKTTLSFDPIRYIQSSPKWIRSL